MGRLVYFALVTLIANSTIIYLDYFLKQGDVISVSVGDNDNEFSGKFTIGKDGCIQYPVIGAILLNGKTTDSASHEIAEKLRPYLSDPPVHVSVEAYNANKIWVIGDAENGTEIEVNGPIHILQLLVKAGFAKNTHSAKIRIFNLGGQPTQISLNHHFKSSENPTDDKYLVYPGSIVYVDTHKLFDWEAIGKAATALLSLIGLATIVGKGIQYPVAAVKRLLLKSKRLGP